MTISFLTTGTRGDTEPYIALGLELKNAGQTVRIAAFEVFESLIKSNGLVFFPIKGDIARVTSSGEVADAMKADNPLKLVLSFNKLKTLVGEMQEEFFNACEDAEAIVYHPGAPIGYYAAQYLNIPSILATPFPMAPTAEYPALIFYGKLKAGRGFNFLTHKIFEQIMWSASSSAIKEFWKRKFSSAPDHFGCPFGRQNTPTNPTIISCSNYVFPRPKDWSKHVHSNGTWLLDDMGDWKPAKELLDFIKRGEPPVYVGFGSMGDPTQAVQTTSLVIEALKHSGQRGILATGWSGLSRMEAIPDGFFILESAPHSWLFPRMAAVIHHGGAGTTAAGLQAGVPAIIIPHSNDQFAWGHRVFELGVGSKPIPRRKLTVDNLTDAIRFVMAKEVKEAAKELGFKIQGENGAEAAARVILQVLETQEGR
jgi:sterol 3beta-glucosyltransferase